MASSAVADTQATVTSGKARWRIRVTESSSGPHLILLTDLRTSEGLVLWFALCHSLSPGPDTPLLWLCNGRKGLGLCYCGTDPEASGRAMVGQD